MPRYRTRIKEIEAFPLEDGRYLIAEEAPRYVDGTAFHDAFEPVAIVPVKATKRITRTKAAKVTRKTVAKAAKREARATRSNDTASSKLAPEVLTFSDDRTSPKDRAIAMLKQGKKVAPIAIACEVSEQTIRNWKKALEKSGELKVAEPTPTAKPARQTENAGERSWMDNP